LLDAKSAVWLAQFKTIGLHRSSSEPSCNQLRHDTPGSKVAAETTVDTGKACSAMLRKFGDFENSATIDGSRFRCELPLTPKIWVFGPFGLKK
jgi:hypothetical protein